MTTQIPIMIVVACMCAATAAAEVEGALDAFLDDAIVLLGFDPAQKADLEAGAVISVGLPDIEPQYNELTVGAAMTLVRRPLAVVTDALITDATFRINTDILNFRRIGDGNASREEIEEIFRGIGYTEEESAETARLLRVKRGARFNFSDAEIAKFRSLQGDDDRARELASATLAEVLQQRFLAYLEGGLASVEPYARAHGKVASPRRELTNTFSEIRLAKKYFTTFYTSLTNFPAQLPADTGSRFYWIKRIADERPAFVLAHRMEERKSGYTVASQLQFYVEHSYNSALTTVACVPVEGGTLVLAAIRLFTDKVTGFASGIKKSIGRRHVVEAMTEHLQEMRQALENRPAGS
jgi:hypothetical protein